MRRIERIEEFLNSGGAIAVYFILLIGILLATTRIIVGIDWDDMTWFYFSIGSAFVITLILIIMVNGLLDKRNKKY